MTNHRILSVGQCGLDHGNLTAAVKPLGVELIPCDSAAAAQRLLASETFNLVLVNRVFDADGDSGLALIRKLKAAPTTQSTKVMLVSNYPESQAEAVAAGALPGFGKSSLGQPAMMHALRAALASQG